MFFHFWAKASKYSPRVKQRKAGEKDTAREASERDWSSLTMFLTVFPIPSTDNCIYLKQLCWLFLQKRNILHHQIKNIYSGILDEMTALPMTATTILSLDQFANVCPHNFPLMHEYNPFFFHQFCLLSM